MTPTPPLPKLLADFNRYFTSSNGVDVPERVSVSRDEWRVLFEALSQRGEAVGEVYGIDIDGDTASPLVEWTPEATDLPEGTKLFTAPQPAQPLDLPLKERPDFQVGYMEGMADGRRCAERDALEAQPAKPVPMTEADMVKCLVAAGCIGTVRMTYESGPYDITRTSTNADKLIRAVESFHHIKEQP